jgi:hypothetical protein
MALAFSSAGSKVFLSAGTPATADAAGFGALTYTEIKNVSDIGMIGPESSLITFNPVATLDTQKLKGSINNGSLDLKGARDTTDAGQGLLITAQGSFAAYAVKVVLQNTSTLYASVLVMTYKTSIGTVNQITSFESKLEISGGVVTV